MTDHSNNNVDKDLFTKLGHALTQNSYRPDSQLLTALIESLPVNVYAKDRDGTFIYANACYCKNVGKNRDEIIGKTDFDIHPEHLVQKYLTDDAEIMSSGQAASIEEQWQSIGGDTSYTHVIKAPLYSDEEQEIIGTIGVFWDVTGSKKTEIELAEERNLLRTVIDNLPDYIYVKDTKSRFILANKAVAKIMGGKDTDDLIGKTDFDFFSKQEAEKFFVDEQYVISNNAVLSDIEELFHDKDGQTNWALTSKLPFKNIEGEIVGLVGMGHDITARKKEEKERKILEAQLLHAQKMETVGTLTAGIAHDFNNLLNIINGYSELLTLGMKPSDPHRKTLEKILQAGRSAAELVSQLMTFSRKQVPQPQVLDLNILLSKTQKMLRRIIGEKIDIQLRLDPHLWKIKVDPSQMEQVIVNFAANARDAMEDGGFLRLETENIEVSADVITDNLKLSPGKYVRFSVIDNGHGMAPEIQQRVFEPFFTTKDIYKGTGLGLATIFGIVEQCRGSIDLQSQPGSGTSFQVYIPKTDETQNVNIGGEEKVEIPVGSENILVVEDETNVRELVIEVLSQHGYTVKSAANGIRALAMVAKETELRFDLLITDVIMPGMSGRELVESVKPYYSQLKTLFMSGYIDENLDSNYLSQTGVDFIQKPFSPIELALKVRRLLDL